MSKTFLLLALGLAACITAVCSRPRAQTRVEGAPDLTIGTFNTNFGLAADPEQRSIVEALEADVLVIQEATPDLQAVLAPLREKYPHQHWEPPTPPYLAGGAAILSRYPLRDISNSASTEGWFDAVGAIVEAPGGDIGVVSVHLKPSGSLRDLWAAGEAHRRELTAHFAHFEPLHRACRGHVVLGDFNESPGERLDVPGAADFRNAVHGFAPGQPTWHFPIGSVTVRHALDHVFIAGELEPLDAQILEVGRSDHYPVLVPVRWVR